MSGQPINLSVIIPLVNEAASLSELYGVIVAILSVQKDLRFEIIFADDGSSDDSWKVLVDLAQRDCRVIALRLRRANKASALAAGIAIASGEVIVMADADLQNDPHDIPRLLEKLDEGFDFVCGWRCKRYDRWSRVYLSIIFNKIVHLFCGVQLNDINCGMKAAKASVFKRIKLYGQLHRFLPLIALAQGAKVTEIPINHQPRRHGKTKYGLMRYFHSARDFPLAMLILGASRHSTHCYIAAGILLAFVAIALEGFALISIYACYVAAGAIVAYAAWIAGQYIRFMKKPFNPLANLAEERRAKS